MPDWYYAPTTNASQPTGTAGTTLLWNTGDCTSVDTSGYYTYRLNNDVISNGQYATPPLKIEPEIKRKKFLQPHPEFRILKTTELKMFDADKPDLELEALKMEYDTIKAVSRYKDQHVFEVYDVPEKPWNADSQHYEEGIEAKGLRKTTMGFYIKDDSVKYAFRRRKIVELCQPPAYIASRRLLDRVLTAQELKARMLLKRYVGEKEFKRYQRVGYIVMSAHGFMWRVPGERSVISRIEQFSKGKSIATYCVHFEDSKIPPTDACLMRMAFINAGLETLKSVSNVTPSLSEYLKVEKKDPVPALSFVEAAHKVKAIYNL